MEARSTRIGLGPAHRRSFAGVVAASALFVGMLSAPGAEAKPEYPGNLQTATGMTCTPACTLCHTDPAGGPGHVRPVNYSNLVGVASGLSPGSSLAAPTDSDSDGKADLDELLAGTDPLSGNDLSICSPNYGCFASRIARAGRAGGADGAAAALALAVAAAAVLAGRRRARRG